MGAILRAQDTFDRADGAIGSNWTTVSGRGGMSISSNAAIASTSGQCGAFWVGADTPQTADQFVHAVIGIVPISDTSELHLFLRLSGTTYYALEVVNSSVDGLRYKLCKFLASVRTDFWDVQLPLWNVGDTVTFVIRGTTVAAYLNDPKMQGIPAGDQGGSINTDTAIDGTVVGGEAVGIGGGNNAGATWASWQSGEFVRIAFNNRGIRPRAFKPGNAR